MCQVLVPVPAPCPPFQPPTHTPPLQNALQISVLANSSLVLGTMVAWGGCCHSLRWLPLLSGWHKYVLQHICDTLEKHKGLALAKRASDLHSQLDKGEVCLFWFSPSYMLLNNCQYCNICNKLCVFIVGIIHLIFFLYPCRDISKIQNVH